MNRHRYGWNYLFQKSSIEKEYGIKNFIISNNSKMNDCVQSNAENITEILFYDSKTVNYSKKHAY